MSAHASAPIWGPLLWPLFLLGLTGAGLALGAVQIGVARRLRRKGATASVPWCLTQCDRYGVRGIAIGALVSPSLLIEIIAWGDPVWVWLARIIGISGLVCAGVYLGIGIGIAFSGRVECHGVGSPPRSTNQST